MMMRILLAVVVCSLQGAAAAASSSSLEVAATVDSTILVQADGSILRRADDDNYNNKVSDMFPPELHANSTIWQHAREQFEDYTVNEIWDELDCWKLFQQNRRAPPRPIHSQSTWKYLRQAYISVVGTNASSIAKSSLHQNGFAVPYLAQQAPGGKGRGVFAADFIPKGSLVWSGSMQTAQFQHGADYRHFLALIRPDIACDVLQWAYVEATDKENYWTEDEEEYDVSKLRVCVDLDEGSFMNDDHDNPLVGCPPDRDASSDDCLDNFYALRDIDKGEELICSYGAFAVGDGWHAFGL